MTPEFEARWEAIYHAAMQAIHASPDGKDSNPRNRHKRDDNLFFAKAASAFKFANAATWADGRTAFMRRSEEGKYYSFDFCVDHLKALRLAHAVASEAWGDVPAHERAFVERVAKSIKPPASPVFPERLAAAPPAPPTGSVATVEAVFDWKQGPRPGYRRGQASARTSTTITGLDPEAFPVVLRLRTPDGGFLDVRSDGHSHYRPVLAPGAWSPCTFAEYTDALASGAAWADRPYRRPKVYLNASVVPSLDEMSSPAEATTLGDRRELVAAERRVVDSCAHVAAIGESVWIRCDPRLLIVEDRANLLSLTIGKMSLAWEAAGLYSVDSQSTTFTSWFPTLGRSPFSNRVSPIDFDPSWPLESEPMLRAFLRRIDPDADEGEPLVDWGTDDAPAFSSLAALAATERFLADLKAKTPDNEAGDRLAEYLKKLLDDLKAGAIAIESHDADAPATVSAAMHARLDALGPTLTGLEFIGRPQLIDAAIRACADHVRLAIPEPLRDDEESIAAGFHP